MKMKDLLGATQAFNYLFSPGTKLKTTLSFKLAVLLKKISPEIKSYNETENKLREEYYIELTAEEKEKQTAEEKAKKIAFKLRKGKKEEDCDVELKKLQDVDINIDIPEIKLDEFPEEMPPFVMSGLIWLIKE